MIKIVRISDLEKIKDTNIHQYLQNLIKHILDEYDDLKNYSNSIEPFGCIFFIESKTDFLLYKEMGLSSVLTEKRFENIEEIENHYCNGLIVLDNDRCINLIGKEEFFADFLEVKNNENC